MKLPISNIRIFFIVIFILYAIFFSINNATGTQLSKAKRILILHSYHKGFLWTDNIELGIRTALSNQSVEIFSEYLDSKRQPLETVEPAVIAYLNKKYAKIPPDLLIISDNNALTFLKKYQEMFFQNIPIVFCGINDYTPDYLNGFENRMTGVVEDVDIKGTLEFIHKLQPDVKKLYIVSGITSTSLTIVTKIKKILKNDFHNFLPVWLTGLSTQMLSKRLKTISSKDAVLLVNFNRDANEVYRSNVEASEFITKICSAPVYGLFEFFLNHGIVGGVLVSAKKQGEIAGFLARDILNNKLIPPVITTTTNIAVFSWQKLCEYGLNPLVLENKAKLVGKPKTISWVIIIAIILSTLLITTAFVCLLRSTKIKNNIQLSSLFRHNLRLAIIFLTITLLTFVIMEAYFSSNKTIEYINEIVLNGKKEKLKVIVDQAIKQIKYERNKLKKQGLSEEQIQKQLKIQLGAISFDNNKGCIFVKSYDGIELVNRIQPKFIGKNIYDILDFDNIKILQKLIATARQLNGGFVSYVENRSSIDYKVPKISYVRGVQDWRWVVGSGIYLDDINGIIQVTKKRFRSNLIMKIMIILALGVIVLTLMEIIARRYISYIHSELNALRKEISNRNIHESNYNILEFQYIAGDAKRRFKELDLAQTCIMQNKQLKLEKIAAESAAKSKSQFLANMSHEIRTPMNAVLGMTNLALQTKLTSKQYDYIRKTYKAANSLLGLINDILDFSKIEAGKLEIENIEFTLDSVLDQLSTIMISKASEKKIELLFQIEQAVPLILIGDPLRLNQILTNLTGNALKFTEEGEVVISVTVKNKIDNNIVLQFSVNDSGIGMTKEQIANIFQPFNQADGSITRKYGGTGLGLDITKKLIELMDGNIEVSSKYGQGTIFTFYVTFKLPEKQTTSRYIIPEYLQNMRTLIVDDSVISRRILLNKISSFSFRADSVNSGKEAIEFIKYMDKDDPVRLILMDQGMPEMDGIEASRQIFSLKNIPKELKIIMVTTYEQEKIAEHIAKTGIHGYIPKPVSNSTLFDVINGCFSLNKLRKNLSFSVEKNTIESIKPVWGGCVLLVEDNDANIQIATELLENAYIDVTLAVNGKKAVELANAKEFDLILMDIQMPEMDGYTATKIIRENDNKTPIVAMTAHAMTGDREKSINAGMNDHITKPINPDELYATLLRWISHGDRLIPAHLKNNKNENSSQSIMSKIDTIDEIDMVDGLRRVSGNKKLYIKLLFQFVKEHSNDAEKIKDAVINNNLEIGNRLAHTIKSTAGNIGASKLYDIAGELESILRSDNMENLDDIHAIFSNELTKTITSIVEALPDKNSFQAEPEKENKNQDLLKQYLSELLTFIEKRKPKPIKKALEHIFTFNWPQEFSEDLNMLDNYLSKYNFKDAKELIKEILIK